MTFSINRYLHIRQAYAPSFSSDGLRLVFLSNLSGLPQAWQVAVNSPAEAISWPDQLTFGEDRVLLARFSPAAGDDRLIFAQDTGGNENAQLFLLAADGVTERLLTTGNANARHIFGCWSDDGREILFAANRRHPGLFDLYRQDVTQPESEAELIWRNEEPGYLYDMRDAPGGRRIAFRRVASSYESHLYELNLDDGQTRALTPAAEPVRYGALHYSEDGRSLYLLTDHEHDFLYLARLNLDSLALQPLLQTHWDCEALALAPDGRHLAYVVNEDAVFRLFLLDLATGQSRAAPAFDDAPGVVGMVDEGQLVFSADSRRLAFSYTGATRTSDIFAWDLAADQVWPLTRSGHGGLPRDSFVAPDLVRYPTFDDQQISAWFYRPANEAVAATGAPAVIVVHGGPESQSTPAFSFLIQYLLHNGYAVLVPNVRGSTGYGKAFSHLDDVAGRMDSVADLAHGAYWLQQQPGIAGDRLAVYGGSYGGFMVLSAMTTYPDLWAAGVNIVGISNFVTFLQNTSEYRRAHREAEYGRLDRDREFLESISPLNHVAKIEAPLMVIHGANDPRVPLSEAQQLVTALHDREVPVDFLVFADEGHGLVKLPNKLVAYPAIVDFLNTHLRA